LQTARKHFKLPGVGATHPDSSRLTDREAKVDGDEHVEQSDFAGDRRAFLKRMAVFAFAAPVISSFALDPAAFAGPSDRHDHNNPPNQYGRNNTNNPPPNQYGYNNTDTNNPPPNQYGYNNTYPKPPPNQYGYNNTNPKPVPKEPCGPDQDGKNQNKNDKHNRGR
jgi:hypothetical protein